MAQSGTASGIDPARQVPGGLSVSNIDFRRGEGGAGRLIVRFSGDGAMPDMHAQGSTVVVDIGNARLPASLQRPLNVSDFATPVQRIDARNTSSGTQLVLSTTGNYESMAYQTGREYIVELVPRATTAVRTPVSASGGMGAMGQVVTATNTTRAFSGRPVTFNFQDVPVRTVLQLIAEESNLNIVASDAVTGNVTLRLINVPWDQALDTVLRAKGLDQRRSGNVVWVAPQPEIAKYEQDIALNRIAVENSAETVTEYIPINYGNAEEIAKLLTEESKGGGGGGGAGGASGGTTNQNRGFLSPRGSISFDRRTNTLLVIDIPKRVAEIKRLVGLLDKPVDQVLIEARIVIANESFARELGARFGISGTADRVRFGNTSIGGGAAPTGGLNVNLPAALAGAGSLALSILNGGYALDLELSALQAEGRGEVISNPRIVTSNQKEAVIRQGQEVGYVTLTGAGTGGGVQTPNVQFKDVLLELRVTPTITSDGRVFMAIAVKKDEIEGFVDTGIGQVPQINKREVNTAVLVENGQTVVIGGVYEFRDRSDISKVPFLADIPVLGNLFKRKGRNKSKAELLIFVTPKVLQVAQRY
ncbi:MAG TPA: type IV pilus secretin PilQ [Xanthomonadaceae bacterium]|nr:type IV pilus secretin PilQ [Xanthomonadaceae bacterium]